MIARLLGAIQFLTVLPVRRRTAPVGQSAILFPIIGAALGATGAILLDAADIFLPNTISALLVLCFWAVISGGLHEDGFADVADALRAGRSREKMLAILKDSRIGAHGALALVFISLVRWQALSAIAGDPTRALAAILALSRASLVVVAWITPPSGDGLGYEFSRTLNTVIAVCVIIQACVFAFFSGAGVLLVCGGSIIILCARLYFMRRIGGVTGDCLGATSLIVETWGLVLFTCQRCM
jgi:adenosylcobinamide-GDP ribazoletransferase